MLRGRIYDVRSVFSVDLTLYCCGVGGGRAQHGRGAGVFATRSRRQSRMVLGFSAKWGGPGRAGISIQGREYQSFVTSMFWYLVCTPNWYVNRGISTWTRCPGGRQSAARARRCRARARTRAARGRTRAAPRRRCSGYGSASCGAATRRCTSDARPWATPCCSVYQTIYWTVRLRPMANNYWKVNNEPFLISLRWY